MKKLIVIFALAFTGSLGFVAAGYADKPPAPPGKNPCAHGETGKPCKPDPNQNGKDCEEHGKSGGVNEDHCANETQPPTNPSPTNPPPPSPPSTNPSSTLPATTSDPGASPPATTTPVASPPTTTSPAVSPPAGKPPKAKPKPKLPPKPRGVPKSAPPPCPVGQVYTARCAPQGSG